MRSASRATSTRKLGTSTVQPSGAGVNPKPRCVRIRAMSRSGTTVPSRCTDPRLAQCHRARIGLPRVDVGDAARDLARAHLLEQRPGPPDRDDGRRPVAAALEPDRRFGLERQPAAGRPDRGGLEPRALERDCSWSCPRPPWPRRPSRRRWRPRVRDPRSPASSRRASASGRRASSAARARGRAARESPGRRASRRRTRASGGRARASRSS